MNNFCFFLNIKMSEKTLKFNNIILNKKHFYWSKEPIDLLSVDLDQIVVSHKFKHNDEGFKYFIGYLNGKIVKPLCIILPQMSAYIKLDSDLDSDDKELMTKLNKSDIDFYDSDSEVESKSGAKLMTKLKKFNSEEI